jgi:hypothetical protein
LGGPSVAVRAETVERVERGAKAATVAKGVIAVGNPVVVILAVVILEVVAISAEKVDTEAATSGVETLTIAVANPSQVMSDRATCEVANRALTRIKHQLAPMGRALSAVAPPGFPRTRLQLRR